MHLLYLDDAGSVGNHEEKYFVLAGIALFERQIHFLQQALDEVVAQTGLLEPERLELHGNAMLAGRGKWRAMRNREDRIDAIRAGLAAKSNLRGDWALFGAAINKAAVSPRDPAEIAFEQICSRFDQFVGRRRNDGLDQRGLIVFYKSTRETRLQTLATEFKRQGHTFGRVRWLADVPFFVDSAATRAIQYADLVTYAIWRKFEKEDPLLFDLIAEDFDTVGGVTHGFYHERYAAGRCDCPYCRTRGGKGDNESETP
ncbi:MAG: DUF3800 domain-containing protein [Oceanicaulis sp.]